jgi:D-glycero-D-manno-heptose 1,7-bisphosphate phosphatase
MIEEIREVDKSWTLFLDRDGVINQRIYGGYITQPEEFKFLPGVLSGLREFANRFGRICIVTNQQGVGKGFMAENQLEAVHQYMQSEIEKAGGRIDRIYYCPDLAISADNCRKPGIKMALQAKTDFPEIDFAKSIMVGDSLSDMEFGKNAGMVTIYVKHNYEPNEHQFDAVVDGLSELAGWLTKYH